MNALGLPAAFIHVPRLRLVVLVETGFSRALEFVHFVLSAKYQLATAVARLRERGDREAVGEGVILDEENNPSPPASPYPLPSERAVINCGPISIQRYKLERPALAGYPPRAAPIGASTETPASRP